jgi:hypothetical protein
MANPPAPDKLTGPVKFRPPKGKPEDRPLERLHQEFEIHQKSRRREQRAANRPGRRVRARAPH